ncbi:DUF3761 domain-containing protein [Actinomadura nitritigenes]|uniref:DUF3761 domain-containing protein n=1 Tax=Actinomadura nitritigenes TaxID=134602 RepID=A0ABS3QVC1_9ACTN|nr:DUF3761 domain-containing protein [Actinomadura nitritigenes]
MCPSTKSSAARDSLPRGDRAAAAWPCRQGSSRTPTRRTARKAAPAAPARPANPAGASAVCRDGTPSYSAHRRGACSHHGGVARWS